MATNLLLRHTNSPRWPAWTSWLFVIPSAAAFNKNQLPLAALLASVALCSFAYHHYKRPGPDWWSASGRSPLQSFLLWLDTALAVLAAFFILLQAVPLVFEKPSFGIVLITVLSIGVYSFFVTSRTYERWHGIWHIAATLFVTIVILFNA